MDIWRVGGLISAISWFCTQSFPSLERGPDKKFKNSELAAIIKKAYVAL